jgi:peptide/nickel transport system permease protein
VTKYLISRVIAMIPVVFLVTMFVFILGQMLPGDPLLQMLPPEEAQKLSREDLDRMRSAYGLDRPIFVQYADWLVRLAQGDLGSSIRTRQPVFDLVVERLPVTIQLTVMSMVLALLVGIPLGIYAALHPRTLSDTSASVISLVGISMPNIFLATVLIFIFSYTLRWLPAGGFVSLVSDPGKSLLLMLMPAFTMGTSLMGSIMRITRASMLEVLNLDYIATARAKGASPRSVVYRHALKNAFIPVMTVLGLQIGGLLGGAFIVEQIFAIPGLGRLTVNAIFGRDFPIVQGVVLFFALTYLFVNLIVDLAYAWLDPRIRYA